MNIEAMLNSEKKGGAFVIRTHLCYEMTGPFLSSSGYLKLRRLSIEIPWGSLWGNTKVFRYWDDNND